MSATKLCCLTNKVIKHPNSKDMKSENFNTKDSTVEAVRNAIMKAVEKEDLNSALELVEYWESKFPLEKEPKTIFYFTKLQVLLKRHDLSKNADEKVRNLHDAIETGNRLFAANEAEGFPMDSEVERKWFELIDRSAELQAFYSDDGYEDDEDDFEEESMDTSMNILSEAIRERIGRIDQPNFKPKPPRKYDDSLKSKLLKAIDCHIYEYGGLDACSDNLLKNICKTLDIDFDDLYKSINDYW